MTERDNPERFRIYTRGADKQVRCVASCADPAAVGVALVTLGGEGEFEGFSVGILDRPDPEQTGKWLVSPWGTTGA